MNRAAEQQSGGGGRREGENIYILSEQFKRVPMADPSPTTKASGRVKERQSPRLLLSPPQSATPTPPLSSPSATDASLSLFKEGDIVKVEGAHGGRALTSPAGWRASPRFTRTARATSSTCSAHARRSSSGYPSSRGTYRGTRLPRLRKTARLLARGGVAGAAPWPKAGSCRP